MDVKGPGEGYYTEVEVRKMLNIDRNVFAVFVGIGLITRDRPNCYLKGEIDKLSAKLKVFRGRYGVEALTRLRSIPIPRKSN